MERYIPPFTISNKMLELVGSIMEKVGKLDNFNNLNKMPVLRRNNRIHSIHSSLAKLTEYPRPYEGFNIIILSSAFTSS